MSLTPLDIQHKEFTRTFRGYNSQEVDGFVNQVLRDFEKMVKDNAALREQIETLSSKLEQYRNLEDTLHNTLVVAQATSEEVKSSARQEAQLIVEEARQQAREHVREAQRRAERILREYQGLRRQLQQFRAQFKGLMQSHLELLEEQRREIEAVPPPQLSAEATPEAPQEQPVERKTGQAEGEAAAARAGRGAGGMGEDGDGAAAASPADTDGRGGGGEEAAGEADRDPEES